MKRHELTDEQWAFVEPLVPLSTARTGRPPKDRRMQLNGIFWILSTGAPCEICLNALVPGKRCTTTFAIGVKLASSPASSKPCR
jgi:transposase